MGDSDFFWSSFKINNASVFLLTANKKFVFGDQDVRHHLIKKWLQFRMEKMKRSTTLCLWEKLLIAAQKDSRLSKMMNGIFSAGQLESYKSDIKDPF